MIDRKFQYSKLKGFIDINTLSPNQQFYYKMSAINESSMAWWCCKIAFYDEANNLIYYRSDIKNAWQQPFNKVNFVKWSQDGNYALIFEFIRDQTNDFLLMDLANQIAFRINRKNENCTFLDDLQNLYYNGTDIADQILKLGGTSQKFVKDPNNGLFQKWYPAKARL